MSPLDIPNRKTASWRRVATIFAAWAPAALIGLGGGVVAAAAQMNPGDSPRLVAVFPPWWSQAQEIAAAAEVGPVAGVSKSGFAVGVVVTQPGAAARLRALGALLVVDGRAFSSCFSSPQKD